MNKITGRALPSIAAIQVEAARVESMIAAATQRMESSDTNLAQALHLQVCRAELHAYFAGLMFALGHTNLLDKQAAGAEFGRSEVQISGIDGLSGLSAEEDGPRVVECFEC